jgi:hypothetical protein
MIEAAASLSAPTLSGSFGKISSLDHHAISAAREELRQIRLNDPA